MEKFHVSDREGHVGSEGKEAIMTFLFTTTGTGILLVATLCFGTVASSEAGDRAMRPPIKVIAPKEQMRQIAQGDIGSALCSKERRWSISRATRSTS